MRNSLPIILFLLAGLLAGAQDRLPADIYAEGGRHHVQGIGFDREKGCMYFSFTTRLPVASSWRSTPGRSRTCRTGPPSRWTPGPAKSRAAASNGAQQEYPPPETGCGVSRNTAAATAGSTPTPASTGGPATPKTPSNVSEGIPGKIAIRGLPPFLPGE